MFTHDCAINHHSSPATTRKIGNSLSSYVESPYPYRQKSSALSVVLCLRVSRQLLLLLPLRHLVWSRASHCYQYFTNNLPSPMLKEGQVPLLDLVWPILSAFGRRKEQKHCNNHNLWGWCVQFSEAPKTFYVFSKWLLGFIFVFLFIITIDNIVWRPNIRCTCWDEPMTAGACNRVTAPIIILTLQVQRCKYDDGNIQLSHCSNYYPSTVHISMQLSLSIVQQPL